MADELLEGHSKRGEYITGEKSDWLVRRIYGTRENTIFFNSKKKVDGKSARVTDWKTIEADYNSKFCRDNPKTSEQLKNHFDTRKGKLRDLLVLEKSYKRGTGGGIDRLKEKKIEKLNNPSEVDSLLIEMLTSTEGALGVGPITLESGHGLPQSADSVVDPFESDCEEIEECNETSKPSTSKRKSAMPTITKNGFEKAKNRSLMEFLRTRGSGMSDRAQEFGYQPKSDLSCEKKQKLDRGVTSLINTHIETSKSLEISFQSMKKWADSQSRVNDHVCLLHELRKGDEAQSALEMLREKVNTSNSISAKDVEEIIKIYDEKCSQIRKRIVGDLSGKAEGSLIVLKDLQDSGSLSDPIKLE